MAYNFYQNQRDISQGLQQQIAGMQENIEAQGKEEVTSRQQELRQQQQQLKIEENEEGSQLTQIKEASVGEIAEGALAGVLPSIKPLISGAKSVYETYQKGKDIVSGLKSGLDEASDTISSATTQASEALSSTASSVKSSLSNLTFKEPTLENLGDVTSSVSSFDSPTNIFQSRAVPQMSDIERSIQQQTEQLNQVRMPDQFGEDINMEGRQLSDIPTAVLPTKPVVQETSFMSGEPVAAAAPAAPAEATTTAAAAETGGETAETGASVAESVGSAVAETSALDFLGPIGAIAGLGIGLFSIFKGLEHHHKPQPAPIVKPPPLPVVQDTTDIQASSQSGV